MFKTQIYPSPARWLFIAFGLVFTSVGVWGIDLSFRILQLSTLVFMLAAGAIFIGFYLFLEGSKVLAITAEKIVVQTALRKGVYPKSQIKGFVNIQLPTTKRRKTQQLTIIISPEGKFRIHSNGLGETYDTIVEMLKRFGYQELTRVKAAQFLDDHKATYRKIGIVVCAVAAVLALSQIINLLLVLLRQAENATMDWHFLLLWVGILILSLLGAAYYSLRSKGYD